MLPINIACFISGWQAYTLLKPEHIVADLRDVNLALAYLLRVAILHLLLCDVGRLRNNYGLRRSEFEFRLFLEEYNVE